MMRGLLLGAVLTLAGCAGTSSSVVAQAPPSPQAEQPTKKPAPHVFWQQGHWAWDDDKQHFFWEAGRWAPERRGEVWIPGYWQRVEAGGKVTGWTWIEPRWEDAPR